MKNQKKNKGFTLIELFVVIAIIGILAGIVVISTSSARNRAVRNSVLMTMTSITHTMSACDQEGGIINTNIASGNRICTDIDDIEETYPTLPDEATAPSQNYAYGTLNQAGGTFLANQNGAQAIVCFIETGRCEVDTTP